MRLTMQVIRLNGGNLLVSSRGLLVTAGKNVHFGGVGKLPVTALRKYCTPNADK